MLFSIFLSSYVTVDICIVMDMEMEQEIQNIMYTVQASFDHPSYKQSRSS